MESYRELLQVIEQSAAEIFATATTEDEVRKLEQMIYDEINRIASARIAELSS